MNVWRQVPTLAGRHVTLRPLVREDEAALVATHNERLALKMDRVVRLNEGRLR